MIRSRTLSVAALTLAGTAAWAWSQSPVEAPVAPSGGTVDIQADAGSRTGRELIVAGDNVILSEDRIAVSGDVQITEGLLGVATPPSFDNGLLNVAEPAVAEVTGIRVDNGSPDVLWTTGAVLPNPMQATHPTATYRFVHRPHAVTSVRSLGLSPEELEQQQEIRKWTEVLHSDQPEGEKEKARAALSALLEKQFNRDLERREKEVAQLEERVKKLRAQVEKRKDAKEKIIELRLDTIEQDALGLGFPEATAPRAISTGPTQPGQPFTIKLDSPPHLPSRRRQ